MRIRLGVGLDGQRGLHAADRLGDVTLGPLGLLGLLETQLGLARISPSQSKRIVQYRDCLKRCDMPTRFYHRSFEIDELGTAATLLGWRDLWHLHGWSGDLGAAASPRLQDMAEVEELARASVAPSIGERLSGVLVVMARRKPAIDVVELLDPLRAFPKRWQEVLALLPVVVAVKPADAAAGECFLGELQRALIKVRSGAKVEKLAWKADGSLTVAQGETQLLTGRWLADQITGLDGDGLIVSTAAGAMLDGIVVAADGARQGFREANAFRPTLQVLPLALEIIWEPLNFYGLLQFLTHPICPLPGFARRKLAAKMAEAPGVGGESWENVLAEIDVHYGDRSPEIRAAIRSWVECPRYLQDHGAPVVEILERVKRLIEFFQVRLGDPDAAARTAYGAGLAQCRACADALEGLLAQGVTSIRARQLQKLVTQATARGAENPFLVPEVGALMAVTDPGAATEHFDSILWWQLTAPALPSNYPWSGSEMEQLGAAGIILPPQSELLEQMAQRWLRPILAAKKRLTLVLPPPGEEVHPVWLMVEALVEGVPVMPLETILTEADGGRVLVPDKALPRRRRWWQLPPEIRVEKKGPDSYSSLEKLVFNPYEWLLRYPAGLRPSRILAVSKDFLLFGKLGHGLVERFFRRPDAQAISEPDFESWFEPAFRELVAEEGAVLLLPGWRADMERLRMKLLVSMRELRSQLKAANITQVDPEMKLSGHHNGTEIVGFADLVLSTRSGKHTIIDMKWAGANKYPEKLKENRHLQLAIYAELLRQQTNTRPDVAYFILWSGEMFVRDAGFFPTARVVHGATDEGTAHLWLRFVETWKWREQQFKAGRFEVVLEGIPDDAESVAPAAGLTVEVLPPAYNDYLFLAGWEDRA